MSNLIKRCFSGIQLRDFVPPVCGKIALKFRNFFHLNPPQKRVAHFQYLPPGYRPDFVLDIGAATGYTAYCALQSFDAVPVHCIEPMERNFEILKKSIENFPDRAFAYNLAVSDCSGETEINLMTSPYANSLFDLPEQYRKDNPDIHIVGKQKVKVETLDALGEKLKLTGKGLLKIDVEGAELNVLSGGKEFLAGHVSAIIIEFAFNRGTDRISQVMELLQKSGFQLVNVFDICRSPAPENLLVQLDAVYIKKQV